MSLDASAEHVAQALKRALPEGALTRIPRHPERRDIVLAIVCLHMRRRYPYTEAEINDYLKNALVRLNAVVDHVTCRRYLVDLGFVKRDRAGTRYYLYYPKVRSTLAEDAIAGISELVQEALSSPRRHRRGSSKG
jgi:hypothetical protein